jgi:antitoxin component of MazEF toxin-antitoxin module
MNTEVTLRREGEGLAVTISPELAELLDVSEGDKLRVVRTGAGYALAPTNTSASATELDSPILRAFEEIREQYDDTFRRLAQ